MKELIENNKLVLMEAVIGEQLRRSDDIRLHDTLAITPLIYEEKGQQVLDELYQGYLNIAKAADVPFLVQIIPEQIIKNILAKLYCARPN